MKPKTKKNIPQEIIIEIFLWLPIVSLMRFRCVSKFFDSLILDSDFIYVHHRRSMIRNGGTKFLMAKIEDLYDVELKENGKAFRWNFNCHGQYFNGPCVNGLYCIWKHYKEPIRIFNPSTRKILLLPNRRKNSHSVNSLYYYSLGYEPIEKKYKVLMQVKNSDERIRNFIFTLSIDKSWRKIKNTIDFFPCFSTKGCSIKGVIYMIDYSKKLIVAFDLRAENFKTIGLGNDICDNIYDYGLIELKGKIALLDCYECFSGRNDLWILENSEKEEWKSHSIQVPLQWKNVKDIPKPINVSPQGFCYSRNGEIIFIAMKNTILECYFYDVGKSSWRHLEIHGIPTNDGIYGVNIYVESLYLC